MNSSQAIYAVCTLLLLGKVGRDLYVGEASLGTGIYLRTEHSARYWTIIAIDFGLSALFGYGLLTAALNGH